MGAVLQIVLPHHLRPAVQDDGAQKAGPTDDIIHGINRHAATILDSLPEPASEDAAAIAEAVHKAREVSCVHERG